MAYKTYIERSIHSVYENGVAKKILQHMALIKNRSELQQARRWAMELLQNARDVAQDGQGVKIQITYSENTLTFTHNGKPFRVKDILSLINQVSGKQSTDTSTVGQFGTGFLSTYQLSPIVDLTTILYDRDPENPAEMLPPMPLQISLDRSGENEQEILEGVHQALSILGQIDQQKPLDRIDPEAYNTAFTYTLSTPFSYQTMQYGITDLMRSALYILLFSKRIESITLVEDGKSSIVYTRAEHKALSNAVYAQYFTITTIKNGSVKTEIRVLHYMEQDGIWIAAEWNPETGYLPLDLDASRVYVDFPLVGSEQFPFPLVWNSRILHPNEPRSGITLVDHENSNDAKENKQVVQQLVGLYQQFIKAAIDRKEKGLSNLIYIPAPHTDPKHSEAWVKENLYCRLYQFLEAQPMLPVGDALYPLSDERMVLVGEEEAPQKVQALLDPLTNLFYPTDTEDWMSAFQNYPIPRRKVILLSDLLEHAAEYLKKYPAQEQSQIDWLQQLFDAGIKHSKLAVRIRAGEVSIFPNQKDPMTEKLFSASELKRDPKIPEILKDVSEVLRTIDQTDAIAGNLRQHLLHQGFCHKQITMIDLYSKSDLVEFISNRTNKSFGIRSLISDAKHTQILKRAWGKMLACAPDKVLYEVYQAYEPDIPAYTPLASEWNTSMWYNSCQGALRILLQMIESKEDLPQLAHQLQMDDAACFPWYHTVLKLTEQYRMQNDLKTRIIFANQNGKFCSCGLKIDYINDDTLKKIAPLIASTQSRYRITQHLLDQRITVCHDFMYPMRKDELAMMIDNAVRSILRHGSLMEQPQTVQLACSLLLEWIRKNPKLAQTLFPDYCDAETCMQLLTPEMAAKLQSKADALDHILHLYDMDDVGKLRELLKEKKNQEARKQDALWLDDFSDATAEQRKYWFEYVLGRGFEDLSDIERENLLRSIGDAGEKYAYRFLADRYIKSGYTLQKETSTQLTLMRGTEQIQIQYPDGMGNQHQPGWDIEVVHQPSGSKQYYEVKTHTTSSSYLDMIHLSQQQMRQALRLGDQYTVLLLDYDFSKKQVIRVREYQNIAQYTKNGALLPYGAYRFLASQK